MKAGARILLFRAGRAVVKHTYVERGRVVSVTVERVLSAEEKERYRWCALPIVVYPRDEGLTWARGWKSKAANALRVTVALS